VIYRHSPDDELSQGDILRHAKLVVNVNDPEISGPKYDYSNIIVLSRNCEIDKPIKTSSGTNSVLVARVVRLSAAPAGSQDYIRKNRVVNAFFLPAHDEYLEDCYVDWRTVQPVDKGDLCTLRSQSEFYKCTLEEKTLEDCFESLFIFLRKPEG
jgi:hypothetical protein